MHINKNNVIFSEKALQKHKRVEDKKKKIGDILHVIKDIKQQEENAHVRRVNFIENRGRFAVLDDSSSDDENYDILRLKTYKSPQIAPVKTCRKAESFIDKKAQEFLQKKRERQNSHLESIYGYWPLPTMKDIMKGKRNCMDYPENALLYELTDLPGGWSIFMEFMEGRLTGGRIGVIENAINNARRKRQWLWSPEEHDCIEREEAEAECIIEEERVRKIQEAKIEAERLLEEERLRIKHEKEEAERLLQEEHMRKIKEEEELLCKIHEAERKEASINKSLQKQLQECIYYRAFNEYLYIPGGWGYITDVFDSGYTHPIQSTISYYSDTDSDTDSDEDSDVDVDVDTDDEDFIDCISDTE